MEKKQDEWNRGKKQMRNAKIRTCQCEHAKKNNADKIEVDDRAASRESGDITIMRTEVHCTPAPQSEGDGTYEYIAEREPLRIRQTSPGILYPDPVSCVARKHEADRCRRGPGRERMPARCIHARVHPGRGRAARYEGGKTGQLPSPLSLSMTSRKVSSLIFGRRSL